ncbi:MAG: tRNA 2-thiouridine(34) synthase MnmA [bacterium]|nr:tRNA 2-thiouridine(34) synthase MnmA [bacterium]
MSEKKRVLVGMSGGVDSSVTAALLLEQGYDVIGITMQLLPKEDERKSACCNLGAVNDAKRVANKLGIPHYTVNSRDNFDTHVISDFIAKYADGLTPNPCVECNRYIKFDELWLRAGELNAHYMATGHYIRNDLNHDTNKYEIRMALDSKKDQSYFLYMLNQPKLQKILFPLGSLTKPEIRKMAQERGLINANKPDSQDICFVSSGSYKDYVKAHIPDEKRVAGKIVNRGGDVLGEHDGIYQFTIGQRKGINVPSQVPLYVIDIDAQTNTVTVGLKGDLQLNEMKLHTFTLVDPDEDVVNKELQLKIRYQMTPFTGTITAINGDTASVRFEYPQEYVTPGQSAVFYDNDRVVGGGVIR